MIVLIVVEGQNLMLRKFPALRSFLFTFRSESFRCGIDGRARLYSPPEISKLIIKLKELQV